MKQRLPRAPRAFITGGGSGLGLAIARQLASSPGARLLLGDINMEAVEAAALELRARGAEVHAMRCDVAVEADIIAAADAMDERWGGCDLLVNNAGVAVAGAVGELSLEDWRWIVDINMWGVVYGCHHFIPRMKARGGGGFILNVASSAGLVTLPEMGPYNVTKAGVIALSETLTAELSPHRIQVSALCPTFFKTNLLDTLRASDSKQRKKAERLFDLSSMTAEQVAQDALRGLESGKSIIIPQTDGKWIWRLRRISPELFRAQLSLFYRTGWLDRLFS